MADRVRSSPRGLVALSIIGRPLRSRPFKNRMEQRMQKRRRFKQTKPLESVLPRKRLRLREQAQLLPRGPAARSSRKESYTDRGCM
jgi:hypothetical protein